MKAERKRFMLRIDPRLWHDIELWAAAELRSVNGQIEYLLREAVARRRENSRRSGPKTCGAKRRSED